MGPSTLQHFLLEKFILVCHCSSYLNSLCVTLPPLYNCEIRKLNILEFRSQRVCLSLSNYIQQNKVKGKKEKERKGRRKEKFQGKLEWREI